MDHVVTSSLSSGEQFGEPPWPRVLLAGLWMVPSMGGMPKTIEMFRHALDARVVSFTDGQMLDEEGSAVLGAEHVRIAPGWRGRFYSWAPEGGRRRADALTGEVQLVSCHTMFRYHVHWVRALVQRRRLPYWVVPHGCLDPYVFSYRAWQKKPWMWAFGRRHLREAAAVIFSTKRECDKASCYLERDNARVIYWPVTNEAPSAEARSLARAKWREDLGLASADRLLLYLGRFHSMKRPAETIASFLRANPMRTHLVMAGPDGDISAEALRSVAGGDLRVHVIGPVWGKNKEGLLAAVDGFISLSIRENFGHSAAEVMRAGSPVLLGPGNDLVGELDGINCGWLLPDGDAPATRAIGEFDQAEDATVAAMGRSGQEWTLRELSFEVFASRLRALARESVSRLAQNLVPPA